jgi:hypothetical protein
MSLSLTRFSPHEKVSRSLAEILGAAIVGPDPTARQPTPSRHSHASYDRAGATRCSLSDLSALLALV